MATSDHKHWIGLPQGVPNSKYSGIGCSHFKAYTWYMSIMICSTTCRLTELIAVDQDIASWVISNDKHVPQIQGAFAGLECIMTVHNERLLFSHEHEGSLILKFHVFYILQGIIFKLAWSGIAPLVAEWAKNKVVPYWKFSKIQIHQTSLLCCLAPMIQANRDKLIYSDLLSAKVFDFFLHHGNFI